MSVQLIDPGDTVNFQIDWSEALPAGVTLGPVTHSVPAPLTKVAESTNPDAGTSTVTVSGAVHGRTYLVEAQSALNGNDEVLNRQFPLRCFNG